MHKDIYAHHRCLRGQHGTPCSDIFYLKDVYLTGRMGVASNPPDLSEMPATGVPMEVVS